MRELLFFLMIILFIVGSLLTALIWFTSIKNNSVMPRPKINSQSSESRKNSRKNPNKDTVLNFLALNEQDENQTFRSQLSSMCHGLDQAIITQINTPLGSKLVYDGEKGRTIEVTQKIFNTFTKRNPFSNKKLHSCAVVGNGGILANSSCGKMIDSSQFVIRCNLPPLSNKYEKYVGTKTDLVTANPSILLQKYGGLTRDQHKFVENLQAYGNSLLLIPAFSFTASTEVSLRAFHVTEDAKSSIQTVFLNPQYLKDLKRFWSSWGLKPSRLSTGMMMVSLAMELCEEVHLYGFWPFSFPPRFSFQLPIKHFLTNHYYDDVQPAKTFHTMGDEFMLFMQLHVQGILRLHVDDCKL